MKWLIMAKYQGGPTEEIDEADNTKTANLLLTEYRMAYGARWSIWKKRPKRKK